MLVPIARFVLITHLDRSKHLPAGSPWTTDADFDAITVYFEAPADEERFNVIRHARA